MKWIAVVISLLTLAPLSTNAVSIPESSEVVLNYENANPEQQTRYNYIFTVNDDSHIYTCAANRCSMQPLRDRGTVTMTIYKLPDGFPRPSNVVDQKVLGEFKELAEKTYVLNSIPTNLSTTENGRPYLEVGLYADGTSSITNANYDKPEFNQDDAAEDDNNGVGLIWKIIIGVGGAVAVGILVYVLLRIVKNRQLRV